MRANKEFFNSLRQETIKIFEEQASDNLDGMLSTIEEEQPYYPDMLRAVQDIDAGIRKVDEIDWEKELAYMDRLNNLMMAYVSPIIWLWGITGLIVDPTKRIEVLQALDEVYTKVFPGLSGVEFNKACHNLIKINMTIREHNLHYEQRLATIWKGERQCLNDLVNVLWDDKYRSYYIVAIANGIKDVTDRGESLPVLEYILNAPSYSDKWAFNNIVDFAQSVHGAESFCQLLRSGKIDSEEFAKIEDFPRKLKQELMDRYIKERLVQIKDDIEKDPYVIEEPTMLECYDQLLKKELEVVSKKGLANLTPSERPADIEKEWSEGAQSVIKMSDAFIKYLKMKIEKMEKAKHPVAPVYAKTVKIEKNYGQINSIEDSDVTYNS